MRPRPQQSQRSQVHSAILCSYLPMKCCIFQGRLSTWFLVTVPVCVVPLHITPLQFHLTTTLMRGHVFYGKSGPHGRKWNVDCLHENIHSHFYFYCFSCFFRSKLVYKSVILAQGRGCVLCCLLILTRTAERLFSTAFLSKLPKNLHLYFRTYRVRVTITWHISIFIHVCV